VLRDRFAADPIFTLATRDMNRLALESLLLGAQALALENVIVVAGDPFGPRDIASAVNDYRPTELIASIASLNSGVDHRGRPLRAPTNFCIGATVDLGRGVEPEAELAARKVEAGAQFLITQPIFEPSEINHLTEAITLSTGSPPGIPIFYGVGLMEPDGVSFAAVPEQIRSDLKAGRSGVDIALEVWEGLRYVGADDCYVVPPIRRSGARNYDAAREFLRQASA
jgi:homocysteine S-methyltransferase